MKFAFAGIDFLGGVFDGLIEAGWTPVKLFTRPCDGIYDHNEVVVAQARRHRIPIQLSRMLPDDIERLAHEHGRDVVLVVSGYPWLVRGWHGRVRYALNLHPSPLPTGRGPYPLFKAVLDGYESWGVTAHVLAEQGFDTGDILAQDIFPSTVTRPTRRCSPSARWRHAASPSGRSGRSWPSAGARRNRRATAPTGRG